MGTTSVRSKLWGSMAACALLVLAPVVAEGATNYRSIGTNAAVLYNTGTADAIVFTNVVTFGGGASLPVPTALGAVGQGDEVTLSPGQANEEILHILSRDSATQVTLQSPVQFAHTGASYSISRAYGGPTALQDWEDARGLDLVALDRIEVGVAYNDGPFNVGVRFLGSTTDATHFMKLTVARGQRHDGTEGTGAIVDGLGGTAGEIHIDDHFTVVEWLEVTGTKGAAWRAGVRLVDGTNALLSHLLIYDNENGVRISGGGSNHLTVRNCVIYSCDRVGIEGNGNNDTADVHNNTIYNNGGYGIDAGTGTFDVINTIAIDNSGGAGDFNFGASTHDYNMSSDASATGSNSITGASAANEFQSLGPIDLHLKSGAAAIDKGLDLSVSFTDDIDEDIRPAAAWDIGADELLVPAPLNLSSASNQSFLVGDSATASATLTITDDTTTPRVTAANDLRVRIPATFNMTWDTAITSVTLGGAASGNVSVNLLPYEDGGKTAVLDVENDFAAGNWLTVSGLKFRSFTAPSAADNLDLDAVSATAVDDKTVTILLGGTSVITSASDQVFSVGDPSTLSVLITVNDGTTPSITTASDIHIRIPDSMNLKWDSTVPSVGLSGSGAPNVSTSVTYDNFDYTVVLDVTTNFAAGDVIVISGLRFLGFTAPSAADNLELELVGAGLVDVDDKTLMIVPTNAIRLLTATATSTQVELEWVNPPVGPYVSTLIKARTDMFPTGPTDPAARTVASQAGAPGLPDSVLDLGLTDAVTQYYVAYVFEGGANYTVGRQVKSRPFDTSGPVKWAYSTGATTMNSPGLRFSGGQSFVQILSNDEVVHSVDGGLSGGTWPSGWTPLSLGGPAQHRPPGVGFAVGAAASGVVFVGSQDGKVYAVDAASGVPVWSVPHGEAIQAAPAGMFANYGGTYHRVLVGTRNSSGSNAFLGLNVDTGQLEWSFTNSAPQGGDGFGIGIISGGASVDYANDRIYFASRAGAGSNTLWSLDFTGATVSLQRAWALGDIDGSPIPSNGRLYVGNNAGTVYAIDTALAAPEWSFPTGDGPVKGFIFPHFGTNNLLFSTNTTVGSIADNTTNATPNWSVNTIPSPSTPLYVFDTSDVLVGASNGRLYQMDVNTGGSITFVTLGDGSGAVGAPTIDLLNLMLYVGTDAGIVYGLTYPLP